MNKYNSLALESRRERKINRSCKNKKRFKTEEEAFQKGQRVYFCNYCNGFHRTGSLLTQIRSKN